MTTVILINSALGAFLFCRALLNINQITRRTCISILGVNLALLIGGLLTAVTPLYGMQLAEIGQLLIYSALAGVMLFGRREVDRVAPRPNA